MPLYTTSYATRALLGVNAQGLAGEVFPRQLASNSSVPTSGDIRAMLVGLAAGDLITNLYAQVTVAGSGVTLAKLGIWSSAGALLASTGELSAQFTSGTGPKGGALSSPYTVPTRGGYYIGFVFVGGTSPTLLRAAAAPAGGTAVGVGSGVPYAALTAGASDIGTLTVTQSTTVFWLGWA